MRKVELIGVAQLEGIRVFLNHLYEAKGIDVCVLTKFCLLYTSDAADE